MNNSPKESSTTTAVLINSTTKKNDDHQQLQEPERIKILIFDLTYYNKTTQFLLCCLGVFILYLIYGYLQELIFSLDSFKPFGWFLTLIQFFYYICFSLFERQLDGSFKQKRRISFKTYGLLALLTLGTMGLSNSSLAYLNYPTQVIFKCCKLIPVLIGSILIQGKKHGVFDFLAALAMCIGLTMFTLADSQVSPNYHKLGILMISGALLCDAAIGNVQEKAMKESKVQNSEVVLYSYGIGFIYLFVIMILTGSLMPGFQFCANHPTKTYGYAFLFSLSGYLGIQFVLTLVRTCGAPLAATVTTARKSVTIALSFLFFSKPFTIQYLWSGLIVILGIYLNVYSKKSKLTLPEIKEKLFKFTSKNTNKRFLIEV